MQINHIYVDIEILILVYFTGLNFLNKLLKQQPNGFITKPYIQTYDHLIVDILNQDAEQFAKRNRKAQKNT